MFHGFGYHFSNTTFDVFKTTLQHLRLDYLMANEYKCDPLLPNLVICHEICEMGHCPLK
jgi:hypothetical protein